MVDIHSHFLPGLDDGARTLEDALAMIEMAAADGTTHLVGTPHCNSRYEYSLERNRALLAELQGRVGHRVLLFSGCDFHLSYENIEQLLADKSPFTLNQGDYLLAEFSDYALAPNTPELLHKLRLNRIIPIVTHPERNRLIHERGLKFLARLVELGCPVQVTAASFTGRFGRRAQEFAEELLAHRLAHIVASDAHDTGERSPRLSPARAAVAAHAGEEVAQALFVENPRAVIENRPLPYLPTPAVPTRHRKRFWFF
jgi:protein-tyrosine phosphatase